MRGRFATRDTRAMRAPPGRPKTQQQTQAIAPSSSVAATLDSRVRDDFPILHQTVHDKPLVYLDSAATSQKPTAVLEAVRTFYERDNANVHRGVHTLAARATHAYEAARAKVARFVNAACPEEIVWTRNASEAINLVAYSWARNNLQPGDEVLVSVAEHHANLVPWQLICKETGAVLRHASLNSAQEVDVDDLRSQVNSKTKLVSVVHVSNMLGCVTPVAPVVEAARGVGARVLLDCCQSVPHMPVDVQALGADWIVASGHKMCAPSGVGFLWGRLDVLETMPPWQAGGEMIEQVQLHTSTFAPPPLRFEAGTPAIGEVVGMGAAVDYLESIGGMQVVQAHEHEVGGYLYERLRSVDGVTIYGPSPSCANGRAALASFNVDGLHATDVSMLLDSAGVALRSGHHCTQPLHVEVLDVAASARASMYIYNSKADVDAFVEALKDTVKFFKQMQ